MLLILTDGSRVLIVSMGNIIHSPRQGMLALVYTHLVYLGLVQGRRGLEPESSAVDQGTAAVEHCCAKATRHSSSGMPEQRDSGEVGCWCGRVQERRSGGAPESLQCYRTGATG